MINLTTWASWSNNKQKANVWTQWIQALKIEIENKPSPRSLDYVLAKKQ